MIKIIFACLFSVIKLVKHTNIEQVANGVPANHQGSNGSKGSMCKLSMVG